MKSLNFNKGIITESKTNESQVNEVFGAILLCGALGMLVSKSLVTWWKDMSGLRADIAKNRKDRRESSAKKNDDKGNGKKNEKNVVLDTKPQKDDVDRKLAAYLNAAENAGDKDGIERMTRILLGKANDEDMKWVNDNAQRNATPEEQKVVDRIDLKKMTPEKIKDVYEKHGIPAETSIEDANKMIEAQNKHLKLTAGEEKKDTEGKTEPAKKDDNKVPYYDTDGNETGMYVVKKEDGSYEMQNEKGEKQEGDVDEKDFDEMKQVRDEKAKKEEPKKDTGDEPTKKEEPNNDAEGEEDDPKNDDERTDNDDDLDDPDMTSDFNIDTNHPKKDPSKVYKKRTYKRGDKTFTTKNYYNKHGISITPEEYKNALKNWDKKKKKNESFTSHPWSITRLYEAKKAAPVMEAEKKTDMETICKERLVYIKYVMDTTSKSVEKVKMERMYNAIYNCCFDSNGKARDLKNLYAYLNDTMVENKGKIPGLPTNEQVENIDEKLEAWRKTSPDKFDAYMTQLEKENLDKHGTKKSDKAKDLLSPENGEDDKGSIEDIRKLSSEFGFTNILGLEPSRKASQADKDNKDEIEKQENDKDPKAKTKDGKDVKSDDVSDEQIDKIIGAK